MPDFRYYGFAYSDERLSSCYLCQTEGEAVDSQQFYEYECGLPSYTHSFCASEYIENYAHPVVG